jgi:hypothetical protein
MTHRWEALKESYKVASDLISIGGLSKELWAAKVPGVQTGTVSGQFWDSHLGVPGAVVSQVSLELPVACPSS